MKNNCTRLYNVLLYAKARSPSEPLAESERASSAITAVLKIVLLESNRQRSENPRWILGVTVDHDEAVQTLATEKYLLGEMCPDLREEFEMHLFDCEQCAFDLWAAVTFLAHAKAMLSRV